MAKSKNLLKANNSAELLSYIINQDPVLKENIPLPVQGKSIAPIGKLIMDNQRYRNAFINTVNLIGLTVIKRNTWDNPWDDFTDRGTLSFGQQIREVMNDLADVYDYNENLDNETRFIDTVVPNVFNYIHSINFQKFYQTTTSDAQLAMAFETEDLFTYIDDLIVMLYESLKYDKYIVNKYMLCRRILDGTMTAVQIENFATKNTRDIVADIKAVSNKMTFRSPNYNPAGIRKATRFEEQIAIINTDFDAKFTTKVLATSYFRSDAEMKANLALIDSFSSHDTNRLAELFGKRNPDGSLVEDTYIDGYVPFTPQELQALNEIPAVIISKEWFMNYAYAFDNATGEKATEFYNPVTLKNNHFLHFWGVFSTSPFENGCVFTQSKPSVSSVEISPNVATVTKGQSIQLKATVETVGFANKAVVWSVNENGSGATIDQNGILYVPATAESSTEIVVQATSVYDDSVTNTATITVA